MPCVLADSRRPLPAVLAPTERPLTQPRIGFVGLGLMGIAIARRLATAGGYIVHGADIDPARRALFAEAGPNARAEPDPARLAAECTVILTCLPGETAVSAVYDALAPALGPQHATIDLSTVPPALARAVHAKVEAAGAIHYEMPVIGTVEAAAAGKVHAVVAARGLDRDPALPEPVAAIVGTIAAAHVVAGGPGAAATMKVLQNGLGLIQLAGIAEVLGACERLGLSARTFAEFAASAPGMANSLLLQRVLPALRESEKTPVTARLAIASKDARLARDLMDGAGARTDMSARSAALFAEAEDAGLADEDYLRILDLFADGRRG